jgi:tetratricopeptide (TPR) repeat protein
MTLSKTTIFGGRNQTKTLRIELWFALTLCLALVSGLVPIVEAGPLVISGDEQMAFARTLIKDGKYDLAVIELERLIYFLPEDPKIREARYLIALSYVLARRYESAREVLLPLMESAIRDGIAEKSLFLMGESYYREGVYKEAGLYFERVLKEHPQPEIENLAIYRLGWMKMHMDEWEAASHTFSLVEPSSFLHRKAQNLASESLLGKDLPYKDPEAAGVLGAVVPGLGHAYVGRYRDGGVAFLLNALFIWASVEAFQSDQNVLGGILAFLELGWYSGSIYSAVNATHKYNRRLRDDFLDGLHEEIDLNRIASNSQAMGLVFRIQF